MKKIVLFLLMIFAFNAEAKIEVINGDGTKTVTYCPNCSENAMGLSSYSITVPIHPTSTMTFEYNGEKIAAIKAFRNALSSSVISLGAAKEFIEDNITSDGKLVIDTSAYDSELIKKISDSFVAQGYNMPIIKKRLKKIYTVEEATKLSKPTGNKFMLRYK